MTASRLTSLCALAILKLQQTENALQTQVSFKLFMSTMAIGKFAVIVAFKAATLGKTWASGEMM